MMGAVFTVARKELRSYFDHPTAYVLTVAFLATGLFLAFRSLYGQGAATLRPFFDLLPWLLVVFIPAITMRSLAEERHGRTLEWLMAQPLAEQEVVLGKFLGDWAFVLLVLAGTLPTALGVLLVSSADPGIVIAQYAGSALLAAQLTALGLFASSVTRNQITAFILGAGFSFLLVMLGTPVVQIGLPPLLSGAAARLSVLSHFDNVARGVIDLRDVVYFLATTGLFLFLAAAALAAERLSHERGTYRRLRLGSGLAILGVVLVGLLGGEIRGRLDLTRNDLYTLSSGSRDVMEGLEDLVTIKLFVSSQLPPEVQLTLRDVRDLLADLRNAADGRLIIEELDPDDDPDASSEASALGITPIEFNVLREDEFEVRRGWFGMATLYASEEEVFPVVDRTDDLEFRLVSAIAGMTAERKFQLAFLEGFGSRSSVEMSALRTVLEDRYELRSLNLETDSTAVLSREDIDLVVVAAPTQPLDAGAIERIRGFLDAGGSALVLLERSTLNPQVPMAQPVSSGLEAFLAMRGIEVQDSIVYDLRSHTNISLGQQGLFQVVRGYPLWPIAFRAGEHATTRGLENLSLAWAAPLVVTDPTTASPLWSTSVAGGAIATSSTVEPESVIYAPEGELAPVVVAAASDPGMGQEGEDTAGAVHPGRLVVVGDIDFATDRFVSNSTQNLAFLANSVDWLVQDEALIRIRSKDRTPPVLVFTSDGQRGALKWGNLVGMPLLFALMGVVRIGRRRTAAERRWED